MNEEQELRFVKKIPPSGGSPGSSFKLSLPYSFVATHLQHFIGRTIELASSIDAPQSWQGRISPRRNKDRNEFILQGWKLFAEAHNIQAGDQVSFEVTSPQRMVIKVLLPVSVNAHLSTTDEAPTEERLAKVLKSKDSLSPQRSAWMSQQNASPIDGGSNLLPFRSSGSLAPPTTALEEVTNTEMAHSMQSWKSIGRKRPSLDSLLSFPSTSKEQLPDQPDHQVPPSLGTRVSATATWMCPNATAASATAVSDAYLPGIFENIGTEDYAAEFPIDYGLTLENGGKSYSLDTPGSLPSCQALEGQSRSESDFRALVARMREKLDASARTALQATMRMETSVMDLPATGLQAIGSGQQASMFKHLSALKESLWQILLIGNEIHSPTASTDTHSLAFSADSHL